MDKEQAIEATKGHFGKVLAQQLERVEHLKQAEPWIDFMSMVGESDLDSRWDKGVQSA